MGTQVNGNASTITHMETQIHDPNPRPNLLGREGSVYNLTLDEIQNQLGGLEKPLSSMNLDELLKFVWLAEGNTSKVTNFGSNPQQPASVSSLDRQCSSDLRQKTVDELWQDIEQEGKGSSVVNRKATFGEMTLEGFLAKAGVVAEPQTVKKSVIEATVHSQQSQWNMNYAAALIVPQQHQPPIMLPVYSPDGQMAMTSSTVIGGGALSEDTQTPTRKRMARDYDIAEKSVERRQKRMIKNRESAARSRARKQAYTQELENKISHLEEENERLRRRQEWEKALPSMITPPSEPKRQLRRTSSASF